MDLRPQIFPHSVVKQDVRNPHFSGQKIFLMLFRKKTLERGSFGKRGRRCITPPPPSFLGPNDSGYPNCQTSEQFAGKWK